MSRAREVGVQEFGEVLGGESGGMKISIYITFFLFYRIQYFFILLISGFLEYISKCLKDLLVTCVLSVHKALMSIKTLE